MKATTFAWLVCVGLFASLTIMGGTAQAAWLDDLVGYWPLDGDFADDYIADGQANDGTYSGTGGPTFAAGKFGTAIDLDGGNQIVTITGGPESDFDFTSGDVSISTWFRVDAFDTGWQALIAKGEGSGWRVARRGNANILGYAGGSGDTNGGPNVNDGQIHHMVAISENGVSTRLWIDGSLAATGGAPNLENRANRMQIGGNPDGGGREWEGLIDDVAIWGRVLTTTEIGQIWNGGTGAPISNFFVPTVHEVGGDSTIGTETLTGTQGNETFGPAPVGRFVRLYKENPTDGRFHVSELEVFADGVVPDNGGQAFFSGGNLSNNDLALTPEGVGSNVGPPGTSSALEHGGPASNAMDNQVEGGGSVWSTNSTINANDPQLTGDTGGTQGIGIVRGFPRNDGCCSERWRNLQIEIYADDGGGNPGALVHTEVVPDPGGNNMIDVQMQSLVSADLTASLNPFDQGLGYTYVFELGSNDQITVDNPDSGIYTTILDINNADIVVEKLGTPAPGVYQLLDADQLTGAYNSLTLPPGVTESGNFNVTGAVFVPEPSTFALAGLGLLGLLGCARRRRKNA